MFNELRLIRNEQIKCSNGLGMFERSLTNMDKKLEKVIEVQNAQSDFLQSLAYRSIDVEARSRSNNLIFRGIAENRGEKCFQLIRDVLENHLDIDADRIYISRAHRLGRPNPKNHSQIRPIIANFRDFCDTEHIMRNVYSLKGTKLSIDYDFPKEIQEARHRLWATLKKLKHDFPGDRIQIVYPAKLIRNGHLVKDELPEWTRYTQLNRLDQIEKIGETRNFGAVHEIVEQQPQNINYDSTNTMTIRSPGNSTINTTPNPVSVQTSVAMTNPCATQMSVINPTLIQNQVHPIQDRIVDQNTLQTMPVMFCSNQVASHSKLDEKDLDYSIGIQNMETSNDQHNVSQTQNSTISMSQWSHFFREPVPNADIFTLPINNRYSILTDNTPHDLTSNCANIQASPVSFAQTQPVTDELSQSMLEHSLPVVEENPLTIADENSQPLLAQAQPVADENSQSLLAQTQQVADENSQSLSAQTNETELKTPLPLARGRSRTVARAASRSIQRSESARPYRRNSSLPKIVASAKNKQSRETLDFPDSKNSVRSEEGASQTKQVLPGPINRQLTTSSPQTNADRSEH